MINECMMFFRKLGMRSCRALLLWPALLVSILSLVAFLRFLPPVTSRAKPATEIPMNGLDDHTGANVLFVIVDTLRFDHLGVYGFQRGTSPNLDRYAEASLVFERAYSHAPWTHPSISSMMTSKHPKVLGIRDWKHRLKATHTTLALELQEAGFHTEAHVSHLMFKRNFGYKRGWDVYDYSVLDKGVPKNVIGSRHISDGAIAGLEGIPEPFFMFLHYFDPHFRYRRHEDFPFSGGKPVDRYDSEIAYTDHHLGRVLDALEDSGLADRTIVVIVADHGEEFLDHGSKQHTDQIYEESVHVPLIMHVPGMGHARVPGLVAVTDIAPSLLTLLGVQIPSGFDGNVIRFGLDGVVAPDVPIFVETRRGQNKSGIVEDQFMLIANLPSEGDEQAATSFELYDMSRDPTQKKNIVDERTEKAGELMEKLLEFNGTDEIDPETFELDEGLVEDLKSLGYMQ